MTLRSSDRSGQTLACASLLVAVIFLLPPLVRATAQPPSAPDSSKSFRLNRGFDKPESKRTLVPPVTASAVGAACDLSVVVPPAWCPARAVVDVLLTEQHEPSDDPQRGPPIS